jgi:gamma-glutamyltranspeptidase / glutathione hydrolase
MKKVAVLCAVAVLNLPAQYSMFPAVRGTKEMVAAGSSLQVEAGWRMLQRGGNATDAGVAAVLAAAVTEQSRIGLGGEAPIILKAKNKPAEIISGVGTAPKLATVDFYRSRKAELWEQGEAKAPIPEIGILSAILPGLLDGLVLALQRQGTLSFREVATPALELAQGHPLPEEFADFLGRHNEVLRLWPTSKRHFFPEDRLPKRGEMYRQPMLAATLQQLMDAETKAKGDRAKKLTAVRDLFYKGEIARKIAAFNEQNGGLIRYEDLAAFHASVDQPKTAMYRGYEIVKPGFWTQGPVMLQALNLLEGYDLAAMGHNSPRYVHTVVEAVKLAFADRDFYYGDPAMAKVPEERLLSREYAAERRAMIDGEKASMESRPGKMEMPAVVPGVSSTTSSAQDTTCVNVVDKWGNAFSVTPSGAWLPSVIAGDTGVPMSSRLQSFVTVDGHPNRLEPGKRPRVTLSPTMILKDGQPWALISTPGGDNQDQAMLQVILNLIDFGMDTQLAVEAPRFQTEHFYASFAFHEFKPGGLMLEDRFRRDTVEQLARMGHKTQVKGPWSNGSAPTVIRIKGEVLEGGADPRRGRFVFGR